MMKQRQTQKTKAKNSGLRPKILQAPLARGTSLGTVDPVINNSDTVRIRKREMVRILIDPEPGVINRLHIDPSDPETFPWLSNIAPLYELYRIHKLSFEFRSSSPSTAPGAFYSAIDYDPKDEGPQAVETLMSYVGASRSPIWTAQQSCRLDTNRLFKPWLYTAPIKGGSSDRLEVPGKYYYSAAPPSVPGNSVGEIYVIYDISFKNTQVPTERDRTLLGSLTEDLQLPAPGQDWKFSGSGFGSLIRENKPTGIDFTPLESGLYLLKMAIASNDGANAFKTVTTGGALIDEIRRGSIRDITDTIKSQFIEAYVWIPRKFQTELERASLHFRGGTALLKTLSVALSYVGPKLLGDRSNYSAGAISFG